MCGERASSSWRPRPWIRRMCRQGPPSDRGSTSCSCTALLLPCSMQQPSFELTCGSHSHLSPRAALTACSRFDGRSGSVQGSSSSGSSSGTVARPPATTTIPRRSGRWALAVPCHCVYAGMHPSFATTHALSAVCCLPAAAPGGREQRRGGGWRRLGRVRWWWWGGGGHAQGEGKEVLAAPTAAQLSP